MSYFNEDEIGRFGWRHLSGYRKMSEEQIRKFKDSVDWVEISNSQKLSEDLIREFQDSVNWYDISLYQDVSRAFICEFRDKGKGVYNGCLIRK